jgi:hypothetical protein
MHMSERSIRDIVLSIEKSVKAPTIIRQNKVSKASNREKSPIPLTSRQRDVIEIVYDSIQKPFGVTEFAQGCFELGASEDVGFHNNGETNRSLKAWLCEKMGMKVKWRTAIN